MKITSRAFQLSLGALWLANLASAQVDQATYVHNCQFWVDPDPAQVQAVATGKAASYSGHHYGSDQPQFLASTYVKDMILGWNPETREFDGQRVFEDMDQVDFRDDPSQRRMSVERVQFDLMGCGASLRQYTVEGIEADRPIAPAFWFEPGDALSLSITNNLEPDQVRLLETGEEFADAHGSHGLPGASSAYGYIPPPQEDEDGEDDPIHNVIHDLNHTNIHTHGWHVDPQGHSDNVFVNIKPGDVYEQFVELPDSHPSGTHWYHAHKHGATAVQVSSGMAGALIVTDENMGLDTVPMVRAATDMILALQQMPYDDYGEIESGDFLQEAGKQTNTSCDIGGQFANRPIFINGIAAPTIQVRKGEIFRWRFIHTGPNTPIVPMVTAVSGLGLDGPALTSSQLNQVALPLYEIATDGLPTGVIVPKASISLEPAYRSDVLFQVTDELIEQLEANLQALNANAPANNLYRDRNITRLYLVDTNKGATSNSPQCVRDSDGNLTYDSKGKLITVKPNIMDARRVLAVIEILDEEVESGYDLQTDYASDAVIASFAQPRIDYGGPGWNPDAEDPYAGIGPLAPISQEELDASGDEVELVHYYGDPQNAQGRGVYTCDEAGGRCTYCGGGIAEFTGSDGTTYHANTVTLNDNICTRNTRNVPGINVGSDEDNPYHADGDLAWINFMICDSVVDSPLPLDLDSALYDQSGNALYLQSDLSVGTTKTSTTARVSDLQGPSTTPQVWSCFEFTEAGEFTRDVHLDTANSWQVSSARNAGHVFHIHVNPFTLQSPDVGTNDFWGMSVPDHTIWKDTLLAPSVGKNTLRSTATKVATRYTLFTGAYVQHCHILTHEDQGMMQIVSVGDRPLIEDLMQELGVDSLEGVRSHLSNELYGDAAHAGHGDQHGSSHSGMSDTDMQ